MITYSFPVLLIEQTTNISLYNAIYDNGITILDSGIINSILYLNR